MSRRRSRRRTRSLVLLLVGGGILTLVGFRLVGTESPDDLVSQAEVAQAEGEFGRALELLDRALEFRSEPQARAALLEMRGLCNLELGREEHCFQDLRDARQLTPELAQRWIREGEAHLRFRQFEDAAALYEQAAAAFPEKDRFFRYAAGCAWYQDARLRVEEVVQGLDGSLAVELMEPFQRDAWWFVAGRRELADLRRDYLPTNQETPTRKKAATQLRDARATFQRATRLLADYDTWNDMESRAGLIRARMDLAAGRFHAMHRLAEVLLELEEDPALEIGLEELLANSLYDAGEPAAASQHFLALRRLYQKVGDSSSARRCLMFSAETLLAAGEARRALDLLVAAGAEDLSRPEDAFLLGRARFLAGEPDFLEPIQEAARQLRGTSGRMSDWFRQPRHGDRWLGELLECLLAGGDAIRGAEVSRLGLELFPDSLVLAEARVQALRLSRPDSQDLARAMLDVLRRAPRDVRLFREWLDVSERSQKDPAAFEASVHRHTTRVMRQFQRDVVEPWRFPEMEDTPRDAAELREMTQALMTSPFVRSLPVVARRSGEALLGELRGDPYLAWRVIEKLRGEGQGNAAWLLHLGLADHEVEVAQFRFLLAEEEVRQGRWEPAAKEYVALVAKHPEDVEATWRLWDLWQRLERTQEARALEEDLWERAPETSGRLLAAWSSLRRGRPDLALRQATVAEVPESLRTWMSGLEALALDRMGRRGRSRELVREVLEQDPEQVFALALLVRDVGKQAARRGPGEDPWWVGTLAPLSAAHQAELGRLLLELEEAERAVEVLDQVLERDPYYHSAALDRVDALLAAGEWARVKTCLDAIPREGISPEAGLAVLRRQVLERVMSQGAEAGWSLLRKETLARPVEQALRPWLLLLAAAHGDLPEALRHLPKGQPLSLEEARFLAMQWAIHAPTLAVKRLPDELQALLDSLQAVNQAAPRDRELDRWLALQLESVGDRDFTDLLLPSLLVATESSLQVLEQPLLRRLVRRQGSLGPQVRRLAQASFESGNQLGAVRLLVSQLAADPMDETTRVLLHREAMEMSPQVLQLLEEDLSEEVVRAALPELVEALVASAGAAEEALKHWESVEPLLTHPGAARVARLRILEREHVAHQVRPQSGGLGGLLADRNQDQLAWIQLQRELTAAVSAHPEDALLVTHAVARTEMREPRQVSDQLRRSLITALGTCASPPWDGFRLLARLVRDSRRHRGSLDEVLALLPPPPERPHAAAISTWVILAEACRDEGRLQDAARCLDEVRELAPHDPALLQEAGMLARRNENHQEARALFQRAIHCGLEEAEPLLWLAQQTLEAEGDLDRVEAYVEQADSYLAAHELPLRIQVLRMRGQLAAVRGSRRANRFFEEAARLSGQAVEGDLDWILRSFVDGLLLERAAAVRAAVPEGTALSALVERLLEAAQRDALE